MIGFQISQSGVQVGLRRFSTAANNISNAITPGFKASRISQVSRASGGTSVGSVQVRYSSGPLELQEGGFSLALNGEGFFRVQTPEGPRFTRAGNFQVDGGGNVVTSQGYPLDPPIQVPAGAVGMQVAADGTVSATLGDGTTQNIGQVTPVRFANPGGLMQEGGNLLSASPASGPPAEGNTGAMVFGAVEGSNVNLADEIVSMIVSRASVKVNLSALKAQDEILGEIVDLRG